MLRKLAYRLFGLLFVVTAGLTWAWMAGAYEQLIPTEGLSAADAFWISPGFQSFPMALSIIQAVIGLALVLGVVPVASQTLTDASENEAPSQKEGPKRPEAQDKEAIARQ